VADVRTAGAERQDGRHEAIEMEVRWGDLGCPTEPCVFDYFGDRLLITQRNIDAAKVMQMRFSLPRRSLAGPDALGNLC
jgi:hypothetical protein